MKSIIKKIVCFSLLLSLTSYPILTANAWVNPAIRSKDIKGITDFRASLQHYLEEFPFAKKYFIINAFENLNKFQREIALSTIGIKILKGTGEKEKKFNNENKKNKDFNFKFPGLQFITNCKKVDYMYWINEEENELDKGFCFIGHSTKKFDKKTEIKTFELTSQKNFKENFKKYDFLSILKKAIEKIEKKDLEQNKNIVLKKLKVELERAETNLKNVKKTLNKITVKSIRDKIKKSDFDCINYKLLTIDEDAYQKLKNEILKNDNVAIKYKNLLKKEQLKDAKKQVEKIKKVMEEYKNIDIEKIYKEVKNFKLNIDIDSYNFKEYVQKGVNKKHLTTECEKIYKLLKLIYSKEKIKNIYKEKAEKINKDKGKSRKDLAKLGQEFLEKQIPKIVEDLKKELEDYKEDNDKKYNKDWVEERKKWVKEQIEISEKNPTLTKKELKWYNNLARIYEREVIEEQGPYITKIAEIASNLKLTKVNKKIKTTNYLLN